jgi:hypothetical protein
MRVNSLRSAWVISFHQPTPFLKNSFEAKSAYWYLFYLSSHQIMNVSAQAVKGFAKSEQATWVQYLSAKPQIIGVRVCRLFRCWLLRIS